MNRLPEHPAKRISASNDGAVNTRELTRDPVRDFGEDDADALAELAQHIKAWGRELGFGAVGISDADLTDAEEGLASWLEAGYHGEMDYMAKHAMKRARPAELVAGTRRVITIRMAYLPASTLNGKVHESDATAVPHRGS